MTGTNECDDAAGSLGCPGGDSDSDAGDTGDEGFCLAWDAEKEFDSEPVLQACHVSHIGAKIDASICGSSVCNDPYKIWNVPGVPVDEEDLVFSLDFPSIVDMLSPEFPLAPTVIGSCCTEDAPIDVVMDAQGLDCAGRVCNEMWSALGLLQSQLEVAIDDPSLAQQRALDSIAYYKGLLEQPEIFESCVLSLHYQGEWVLDESLLRPKLLGNIRPVSVENYECMIETCQDLSAWEAELAPDDFASLLFWYDVPPAVDNGEYDFTCLEAPTYSPGDAAGPGAPEPPSREASPGSGSVSLGGAGLGGGPTFAQGTVRFRADEDCGEMVCVFAVLAMEFPLGSFDVGPYSLSGASARLHKPAYGSLQNGVVAFGEGALTFEVTATVGGKGKGKLPGVSTEPVTFYLSTDVESIWTFDGSDLAISKLRVPLLLGARANLTMDATAVHALE